MYQHPGDLPILANSHHRATVAKVDLLQLRIRR